MRTTRNPLRKVTGSTFTREDPESQRQPSAEHSSGQCDTGGVRPLRTYTRGAVPEQDLALATRKDR